MRLCHIVPSLEERHGGPSKSVYALGRTLARLGHETTLLATRRGEPATRYDDGLRVNPFARDRPRRFCASAGLRDYLKSSASDIVHHHSLWLRTLHYAHQHAERQGVPLITAEGGCYDGLTPSGCNQNQGAESILAYHLSWTALNAGL